MDLSGAPNDEAVACSFDDLSRELLHAFDLENALHLGQQAGEQTKFPPVKRRMAASSSSEIDKEGKLMSEGTRCQHSKRSI